MATDQTKTCARCEGDLEEGSAGRICAGCSGWISEYGQLFFAHFERIAAAEEAAKAKAEEEAE